MRGELCSLQARSRVIILLMSEGPVDPVDRAGLPLPSHSVYTVNRGNLKCARLSHKMLYAAGPHAGPGKLARCASQKLTGVGGKPLARALLGRRLEV